MRFSALIAFMLPLSALAAPALVERQSQVEAQLDRQRTNLVENLVKTTDAVNKAITQAESIRNPRQTAVVNDLKVTQRQLSIVSFSVRNIAAALEAQRRPEDRDQFNITKNVIQAQILITALENKFDRNSRGNANDAEKLKQELAVLQRITVDARQGIAQVISAGLEILKLQNKSVGDLFRQFNEPPPPGFN